jgi:hypothetical protein
MNAFTSNAKQTERKGYRCSIQHRLVHDRSLGAVMNYVLGGALMAGAIFLYSGYKHSERDTVLPFNPERVAVVYGRTIDIRVVAQRDVPVCPESKIKRRLVLYRPGQDYPSTPAYQMSINDDNVMVFHTGAIDTHLIAELPASLKPGTHWKYQPIPINGCPWYVRFLPWYKDLGRAPGASIDVQVANVPTEAMAMSLPFVPRPAIMPGETLHAMPDIPN